MPEMVLLGDEALAMGAIDAGISAAYAYPGTPSSEIMEYLQAAAPKYGDFVAEWCSNEKTAYEAAVGVSLVGRRALVSMKHVGLNVAADPFINSALLAIHGGLVLAVADDPGMHSSQNEQDSRFYADFARIICLEPRTQGEVYTMTREAFDLSERFHIPIMLRLTTRIAHSRAVVQTGQRRAQNPLNKSTEKAGWMLLPATARKLWAALLARQGQFLDYAENSPYNTLELNEKFTDFGVITAGLGWNYYMENLDDLPVKPSHLHISVYPLPVDKIRKLSERVKRIVVIEEGFSFVERALLGILPPSVEISGKEDGALPRTGELTPDNVRGIMGLAPKMGIEASAVEIPGRPPQLCAGCPHRDSYDALNRAVEGFEQKLVTSDIGCYTLGYLPPHQAIETCLCMGASVGMAKGAAQAGFHPVVGVIGDSTFLHSGITPLVDAVASGANMTLLILDNSTTAMTGGQQTILTSSRLEKLVHGLGVDPDHIKLIAPLRKYTQENAETIRKEMEYEGVSVIIALRDCIQTLKEKKNKEAGL
ncbi:MAG: indolepyruvate ferredoxin oxidoreductase [Spirochaetaceae bacterium]|nr:MAG: indolepyruvate ferredoxin oxidoreductase [Spirochaetaceae bacterium]